MKNYFIFSLLFILTLPIFASSLDSEIDKYWGARRKIVVIQKKEFTKENKMELTLAGGIVPNDAFFTSYPIGLKFDYFLSEFTSLTFNGSYNFNSDTGAINTLDELGAQTDFMEKIIYQAQIGIAYSFLYGKVAFGKMTLSYFDTYALLNAGIWGTEYSNKIDNVNSTGIRFGGGLGIGFRFYLSQNISFRFETKQSFFMRTPTSDGGQGGVQKPLEITVGIGWLF